MTKEEFYRIYANTPIEEHDKRYWSPKALWSLNVLYKFVQGNDELIRVKDMSESNRTRLAADTDRMIKEMLEHDVVVHNDAFKVNRKVCFGCSICDTSKYAEGACGCHPKIS